MFFGLPLVKNTYIIDRTKRKNIGGYEKKVWQSYKKL